MNAYADSNFFTRLYIETEWTEEVLFTLGKLMSSGGRLPVLWLHRVEIRNAFELFVFAGKQGRGTRFAPEATAAAQARFRADCRSRSGPFRESALSLEAWEHAAEELSLRHSSKLGFRTYDVLHVAAAKELGADIFYSYDERCNQLAALEGLKTPFQRKR